MKFASIIRPIVLYTLAACRNEPKPEQVSVEVEPLGVTESEAIRTSVYGSAKEGDTHLDLAKRVRDAVLMKRVRAVHVPVHDLAEVSGEEPGEFLIRLIQTSNNAVHGKILDEVYQAITDESVLSEGVAKN